MIDYNKIVAWMPHSSTYLPLVKEWGNKNLIKDSKKYTDLFVDKLFDFIPNIIKSDYARHVVDLERYEDDSKEVMSKYGLGVLYTKLTNGKDFKRSYTVSDGQLIYYYRNKHDELKGRVESVGDGCLLLDLHSFSKKERFVKVKGKTPDICIGYNSYDDLAYDTIDRIEDYCKSVGIRVGFNNPYSGAMTANTKVNHRSVMIEVNKDLYLIKDTLKSDYYKVVQHLKNIIEIIQSN